MSNEIQSVLSKKPSTFQIFGVISEYFAVNLKFLEIIDQVRSYSEKNFIRKIIVCF